MNDPTTDALAELRAALERVAELDAGASNAPWTTETNDDGLTFVDTHDSAHGPYAVADLEGSCSVCHANQDFIAAARTDYPRLARVVAAMLAVCDNLDQPGRHPDRRQVAESVRNMAVAAWGGDL